EATLSKTLGDQASGFFKTWTWNITLGVENRPIKNSFLEGRKVKLREFGRFLFGTGKNFRLKAVQNLILLPGPTPSHSVGGTTSGMSEDLSVDGNRFAETSTSISDITFGADGFLSSSISINAPVFVTLAARSSLSLSKSVEPNTWYL